MCVYAQRRVPGSGAGLGILLALARSQHAVTLIESHHKKSAFLRTAVNEFGLTNVETVAARVEAWPCKQTFDTVIYRALGDLDEFVRLVGRLCAPDGILAAMKIVYPHEELTQIPAALNLRDVIPHDVPGVRTGSHLVLLDPSQKTA